MFKDYDKYLSTSLKVYILVLVIVFIMKIVGLDYFGLAVDNPVIIKINEFCLNFKINYIWYLINLFLQLHLFLCIVCKNKKVYFYSIIGTLVNCTTQIILTYYSKEEGFYSIISTSILFFMPMIINKKIGFKRQIKFIFLITFYQLISMFIRNVNLNENFNNFILDTILNIDQLLLLIVTYKIIFIKEVEECSQVVGFSLQKLTNLKSLPKKLQRNWRKFKQQDKVDKITFIIYFALTLLWNIFTFVVILLVAMLNDTFIECIFIITSFWLSKRAFGKAFHLKSMIQCFIVSNITYYILNRITTPLGISILIPIMLGVGLSYVTSKLVKKTYKPLYRGMTKEMFEETILQIVDKDSLKYKICYDFYINKKSDLSLSMKYNYSVMGIRKIKSRINDKIKEL